MDEQAPDVGAGMHMNMKHEQGWISILICSRDEKAPETGAGMCCIILETGEVINKNLKLEQGWMIQ
jgi:hypothetical protein